MYLINKKDFLCKIEFTRKNKYERQFKKELSKVACYKYIKFELYFFEITFIF